MASEPGKDLAIHIGATVGSLAYGSSVFWSEVVPPSDFVPVEAVFCLDDSGPPTAPYLGAGGVGMRFYRVIVRVRAKKDEYNNGLALAREVFEALQYASIGSYVNIESEGTGPGYIGPDAEGSPEWVINVRMEIIE